MGICVLLFVKETKGRTLEEMDVIFGAISGDQRRADLESNVRKVEAGHAEHIEEAIRP